MGTLPATRQGRNVPVYVGVSGVRFNLLSVKKSYSTVAASALVYTARIPAAITF